MNNKLFGWQLTFFEYCFYMKCKVRLPSPTLLKYVSLLPDGHLPPSPFRGLCSLSVCKILFLFLFSRSYCVFSSHSRSYALLLSPISLSCVPLHSSAYYLLLTSTILPRILFFPSSLLYLLLYMATKLQLLNQWERRKARWFKWTKIAKRKVQTIAINSFHI